MYADRSVVDIFAHVYVEESGSQREDDVQHWHGNMTKQELIYMDVSMLRTTTSTLER